MLKKIFALLLLTIPFYALAQEGTLTGNVFDDVNRSIFIEGATVRNLKTKTVVLTDKDGHFAIKADKGDLVTFSMVGYHTDTLYITNIFPRNIFLVIDDAQTLKQVDVKATKISPYLDTKDPNAKRSTQIDLDKNRGGVRLALGYGKMKRQREKENKLEAEEDINEAISAKFTPTYIRELVKFEGTDEELNDFIALYRPTITQVQAEEEFNYDYYTANAYHSWLRLPKEQRKRQKLGEKPQN